MPTYKEMREQIAKLMEEAEAQRRREVSEIIADIRQKMKDYNLTPADLGYKVSDGRVSKREGSQGEPKYRDPATGATWTGKGKAPRWIKEYIATGKSKEDLRI